MFLILLLTNLAFGATWEPAKNDQLKLDFGIVTPSFDFAIKGPTDREATFQPNLPAKVYLGFAYRNVGLGYSFPTKPPQQAILDRGETNSTDFQFRFTGRHSFEFAYQSYSGYYIGNSGELDAAYGTGEARIKKSDVTTRNYAFLYLYNFDSEDYSLTAAVSQTARQTSSGWGRFIFLGYNDNVVSDNGTIIPAAYTGNFGELGSLKRLQQRAVVAGGALAGTLTTGKFFITGLLGVGAAGKMGTAEYQGLDNKSIQGSGSALIVRFGVGYNGEYHVVSLTAINDATSLDFSGGSLNTQLTQGMLSYSYRLDGINIPPLNLVSSWLD